MNQNDNDMHLIRGIVREQLITLWAFHKRNLALDEFQKFLTEVNSICHSNRKT